jgi:hypothetical protein
VALRDLEEGEELLISYIQPDKRVRATQPD